MYIIPPVCLEFWLEGTNQQNAPKIEFFLFIFLDFTLFNFTLVVHNWDQNVISVAN